MSTAVNLSDLPSPKRERIERILSEILPICRDLTDDEMGWVASACLRFFVLKLQGRA
jgi:hypothetical protein